MTRFVHKIDRAGYTGKLTAHFESEGGTGPLGAQGLGRALGLPQGEYDEDGWLKAAGGQAEYQGTAAQAGRHKVPPRMTLTVMQDGAPVLTGAFTPIETAEGELDINVALLAGRPLSASPEQLAKLAEVDGKLQQVDTKLEELADLQRDTAQTTEDMRSVAATYSLGREPRAGDPAGTYRVVRGGELVDVAWTGAAETGATGATATLTRMLGRGAILSSDRLTTGMTPTQRFQAIQQMFDDGAAQGREVVLSGGIVDIARPAGVTGGLKYYAGQVVRWNPDTRLRWAVANTPGVMLEPSGPAVRNVTFHDLGLDQRATEHDGNSMCMSIQGALGIRLLRPRWYNVATMAAWCHTTPQAPTANVYITAPQIYGSVGGGLSFFGELLNFDIDLSGSYFERGADDAVAIQATPEGIPRRGSIHGSGFFMDWADRHPFGDGSAGASTPHAVLLMGAEDYTVSGPIGVGSVASMFAAVPLADAQGQVLRRNRNLTLIGGHAINGGITDEDTAGVPGGGWEIGYTDGVRLIGVHARGARQSGLIVRDSTGVEVVAADCCGNGQCGAAFINSTGRVIGGRYNDNGAGGSNPFGILVDGGHIIIESAEVRDTRDGGARTQQYGVVTTNGGLADLRHVDARGVIYAPTLETAGGQVSAQHTRTRSGRIYHSGQATVPANDGGVYVPHGLAAPPTRMVLQVRDTGGPASLGWEVDPGDAGRVLVRDALSNAGAVVFDWEAWC